MYLKGCLWVRQEGTLTLPTEIREQRGFFFENHSQCEYLCAYFLFGNINKYIDISVNVCGFTKTVLHI